MNGCVTFSLTFKYLENIKDFGLYHKIHRCFWGKFVFVMTLLVYELKREDVK